MSDETRYTAGVDLGGLKDRLKNTSVLLPEGRVQSVVGLSIRVTLPGARVGDAVTIHRQPTALLGQVVGLDGGEAIVMPLGDAQGIGVDDLVQSHGRPLHVAVSSGLLGRVVDGLGRPIDGGPAVQDWVDRPLDIPAPPALQRRPITRALGTGVRVLDGLLTLGEGQRVGLFAGSGVGKSTLLGEMARGTVADIVVVALVGERGREVGEFLTKTLGEQGRRKSVVVVATSDAPAMERLRAAQTATAIAEYFRDLGKKVLLLVDSITRFARAQREVGLAAGELPARRGYPPSVFAMLPRLLERSGQGADGSITAVYTVLVEGGDMEEPIADEVRGILDGHIVLDREMAARGHYPAVNVLQSLSRVMDQVVEKEHWQAARSLRRLLAAYESKRDLIVLGAYSRGSDPLVDEAIRKMPKLEAFLTQWPDEVVDFEQVVRQLTTAVQ
ncbi:MAG TPA: FliI/YscN family ATPase [Polyangiaceae bacterium]|nr:FliI/YscN family ATPase [Polyangiaceae bacterium]HNZ21242.1 FliI/YscN family ATPase [Polyangiaceae bacterium]HOD21072.1 FliI/YscN family ATPase [Polyangiaceae bacterium]HOG99423.1 FliI/YscN family ATPase [Polyangiaceae bacterium]HOR34201.1 FliI/YscN family ATPase [Polyangiaceae bacterium]